MHLNEVDLVSACKNAVVVAVNRPNIMLSLGGAVAGLILLRLTLLGIKNVWWKKTLLSPKEKTPLPRKITRFCQAHQLHPSQVKLIKTNKPQAFVFGWFRPKIYLSCHLVSSLSPKELEAVLLHELYHLKHKHHLLLGLLGLVRTFRFVLPVINDLERWLKLQFEIKADRFAITYQTTNQHLKHSLIKAVKLDLANLPQLTELLQARVHYLITQTQPKNHLNKLRLALSLIIWLGLTLSYQIASTQAKQLNHKDKYLSLCLNQSSKLLQTPLTQTMSMSP